MDDVLLQRRMARLREWSRLLDAAFRVPGTRMRFGWDPILGLIPGLGDMVAPLFSAAVLVTAIQLGIPRIVQLRMLLTALIDVTIGVIPVVGDLFDFVWKANQWNLALLERHARTPHPPSRGDYAFVTIVLGVLVLAAAAPVILLVWFVRWLGYSLL